MKIIQQTALVLLIICCFYSTYTQECAPQYILDNIIQDQIVMYPNAQNGVIVQTQTYQYPRTLFSSTPKIIASIDNYQSARFTQLNYFLTTKVGRFSIDFTFNSTDMEWAIVGIKFWLIARADILFGSFFIQNINAGSQKSFDIVIPSTFSQFVDSKIIQLNFITGIKSTTTGANYQIDVKNSGRAADNSSFKVTVMALNQTNIQKIQVSYIIFNFQSSYFASGGGQINYKSIKGSQYKKIHSSFSPILYIFEGFNKIILPKNDGFNLQFYFDNDYVLQTYTGNIFNELGIVYLSIGKQPSLVCSCDKYIQFDGCIDACPSLSYPYVDYAKGGKTCLTCSAKLNETINQFNTGCVCMDGFQRIDDICIPKTNVGVPTNGTTKCSDPNSVLSNGVCVCISGTQKVNEKCVVICGNNQVYDQNISKCICNFGYYNISGTCGVCPANQIYDSNFKACMCPQFQFLNGNQCQCIPRYYNFSNSCVRTCPTGYIISNKNCVPSAQCQGNSVFQQGKCVCVNNTYLINQTCSTCPSTTYYNASSLSCINCLAFCDVCFNFSVCAQCRKDYYYNSTSNTCVMNTTCKANQQLNNGICVCINGTYKVNDTCTTCQSNKFYNSATKSCLSCPLNCNICAGSTNCQQCLPNHTFITSIGYCAPNCGANQTFSQSTKKCQCITGTYRINNVCTRCPLTNFYNPVDQLCYPCMINCLTCTGPGVCDKCINLYIFNQTKGLCEPSNCPINQTFSNGKCDCQSGTYRINGVCGVCLTGQFYNSKTVSCNNCSQNCVKCSNQLTCQQCEPYHRLVNFYCKFTLYDLKNSYPKFGQNVVITDFTSSQPNKTRSIPPQELQKIVNIKFDNKQIQPKNIIINQNPKNLSQIRVIYTYCGTTPLKDYNATFVFSDPKISPKEDIQNVNYNVISSGYTDLLNS